MLERGRLVISEASLRSITLPITVFSIVESRWRSKSETCRLVKVWLQLVCALDRWSPQRNNKDIDPLESFEH